MKKLVIFGTGALARLAYIHFSDEGQYEVIAFTVNEEYIVDDDDVLGLKVVPFEKIEQLYPPDSFAMFVAIGTKRANKARAQIYNDCKAKGYELASCLNTKSNQLKYVKTGHNCLIMPNVIIQPFAEIGNDVIIWSGSYVGYSSQIGDHSYIAAAAVVAGSVKMGQYCFVGANATVKDGLTLAPESVIGAGAVILKDTEMGRVYGGHGADIILRSSSELKYFK
jgi:sugar O-acyltransferase (sialic acid O-acetyltransferase NeuD family)